jgi:uncharacterized membrane protein
LSSEARGDERSSGIDHGEDHMNPFDLKALLMEKHGQHVVLIHFPIALFITGAALDFAAHWSKKSALAVAAYINLQLAAIATVPAVATGLIAWQWALEGQRLKGILLEHMLLGLLSTALIWTVGIVHFRARQQAGGVLPGWRFTLEFAGIAILGLTGHLGGFLSGVNT